jgi:hypothetical protein
MPLERDLIVFSRVAVELSRIDQWKISADHGFFSNPSASHQRNGLNARLAVGYGVVIRKPSLIVSAQLREPKSVADLLLVPSYSPTHRL